MTPAVEQWEASVAGRKDEALRVAIEAQIETLPRYQRSMRNYAAALTESETSDDPATH